MFVSTLKDQVYITDQLAQRARSFIDHDLEKTALQDLARQMIDDPEGILPRLVDYAIRICGATSGGISIYESSPAPGVFRWHHLRGELERFTGATTPRNYSPCGTTLDISSPVLVQHPERYYRWLVDADVSLPECLLVPLYVGAAEPLGTLWIVSENEGHFNQGHSTAMIELATFVGIALKMHDSEVRMQQALEQQELLTREMSHRIKNVFMVTSGMLRMSARYADSAAALASSVTNRLDALAGAHSLVFAGSADGRGVELRTLLQSIISPHDLQVAGHRALSLDGPAVQLEETTITPLSLVFNELATNSAKYGAFSDAEGHVAVTWVTDGSDCRLTWTESDGPTIAGEPIETGFGSLLTKRTLEGQLRGSMVRHWRPEGLVVDIVFRTDAR